MIDIKNLQGLDTLPDYMRGGIIRYLQHGIKPGSFLTAILQNDLEMATLCASDVNIPLKQLYVELF